ncbi:MAG TPA: hypothetical protein VL147_01420, partial [Devosia sp.]|nr:hypothetical protein [Devosia sp.]
MRIASPRRAGLASRLRNAHIHIMDVSAIPKDGNPAFGVTSVVFDDQRAKEEPMTLRVSGKNMDVGDALR